MAAQIDVFISYKREERTYSESVKDALISSGYRVVTDLNIAKNAEFGDAIDTMIRTAKLTLVLWTNASVASDWVRKEARLALDLEKAGKPNRYLGVLLEDVGLELPPDLRGLQMVAAHKNGLNDIGVLQIIESVRDVLGPKAEEDAKTAEVFSQSLADEWQFYDIARTINVAASYERYLARYPNGEFSTDARRQLRMFTWYLHPFRRANISNTLAGLGILTTVCVTLWATSKDPVLIGVDAKLHQSMLDERDRTEARVLELEAVLSTISGQDPTVLANLHGEQLKLLAELDARAAEQTTAKAVTTPLLPQPTPQEIATRSSQTTEAALSLDRTQRKEVQLRLNLAGQNVGRPDGALGAISRRGILSWQAANGFVPNGYLNAIQHQYLIASTELAFKAYIADNPTAFVTSKATSSSSSGGGNSSNPSGLGDSMQGVGMGLGEALFGE